MNKDDIIEKLVPVFQVVRQYHQHSVIGMDNIPPTGRALVAVNHSLATYDIILLLQAIFVETGRLPRPLIDRLFFRLPFVGDFAQFMGSKQGSQENAEHLLKEEEIITVAPGGMREALRPSTERYQIRWERRYGFCKLAIRTQTPIILAACPKADDLYDVFPSRITKFFYQKHKIPVFLARGLGLSALPRPIRLTHFLSEPITPPPATDDPDQLTESAKTFHKEVVARMEELMARAVRHR